MKRKIGIVIMFFTVVFGTVFVPAFSAYAQDQQAFVDNSDSNDYETRLQACDVGNLTACLVNAFYYLVLTPSAWFARITGELFDYFVQYSLDTNSYRGNDGFIEKGWSVVRDIGNIMFIFALLYIAITHILQAGNSGTKKFLINLIIAALLINFSLFFCRVIIDAGNVLARAFYNNIEIPNDDNIQYRTISQGIVMHVNPQRILGSDLFKPRHSNSQTEDQQGKLDNGYAFTILAVSAAVNITLGITFLSVALLFLGRVVGLWFLMIFSPFALASIAVPNSSGIFGKFSWGGWLDQTMKLSFMAPVFLFFLFLLIMFLQIIFDTSIPDAAKTTVQKLMAIIVPFAMVIFILNKAKSVATEMAGDAGSAIKGVFGKIAGGALAVTGVGVGAAVAGTAYLGRNVGGRLASATLEQGKFQEKVRLNNIRAAAFDRKAKASTGEEKRENERKAAQARSAATRNAIMVKQLDKARKGTWDVRKTSTMQKATTGTNFALSNLGNMMTGEKLKLDLGKFKDTNRQKYEEEQQKKVLETAKLYDRQGGEDISMAEYAAKKGLAGQEELVSRLKDMIYDDNKRIEELVKKGPMISDVEKDELAELRMRVDEAHGWQTEASRATTDGEIKQILENGKEKDNPAHVKLKEDIDKAKKQKADLEAKKANGTIATWEETTLNSLDGHIQNLTTTLGQTKEKIDGRRGLSARSKEDAMAARQGYANVKENDALFALSVGERKRAETADKIRKKPEDAMDKIKKIVKAQEKEDGEEEKKPAPPPPPPPPSPPSGGGP